MLISPVLVAQASACALLTFSAVREKTFLHHFLPPSLRDFSGTVLGVVRGALVFPEPPNNFPREAVGAAGELKSSNPRSTPNSTATAAASSAFASPLWGTIIFNSRSEC